MMSLNPISSYFAELSAAPMATKNLESSGNITSSSLSSSVSMNRFLSSERNDSGPPRNATLPFIVCPHASPLIVWLTTAWNIEADRSSIGAPSLISGCMSVFANTPHLAAIGYIMVCFFAASLSPEASVLSSAAIWSMNAPVPPAHVPFILCSIV